MLLEGLQLLSRECRHSPPKPQTEKRQHKSQQLLRENGYAVGYGFDDCGSLDLSEPRLARAEVSF